MAGRNAKQRFPNGCTEGLLHTWLNCEPNYVNPPSAMKLRVPTFPRGGLKWEEIELNFQPSGFIPVDNIDYSNRSVSGSWPPKGAQYDAQSPDVESEETYGPFKTVQEDGKLVGVSSKDARRMFLRVASWPHPLKRLVPNTDGADIRLIQNQMRSVVEQSRYDMAGASKRAKDFAIPYVSDGRTTRKWAQFWPAFLRGGAETVLFEAESWMTEREWFSIDHWRSIAIDVPTLLNDQRVREMMGEYVPTRRAWGPAGLFWMLLLDRLDDNVSFRRCQRCGRFIEGIRIKKFCSGKDNPECHRERRAADQRKSRDQRSDGAHLPTRN